jgi:hypothetical protein
MCGAFSSLKIQNQNIKSKYNLRGAMRPGGALFIVALPRSIKIIGVADNFYSATHPAGG